MNLQEALQDWQWLERDLLGELCQSEAVADGRHDAVKTG